MREGLLWALVPLLFQVAYVLSKNLIVKHLRKWMFYKFEPKNKMLDTFSEKYK